MTRILIITDSLGFPRGGRDNVDYGDTYIGLLKREFPGVDFIHQGRGGATIRELFQHSSYYHETVRPNLVIMQTGVVDCAPRALRFVEQQAIKHLPVLNRVLPTIVKRYSRQLRMIRKISYTSTQAFSDYVDRFDRLFEQVFWIGILPANTDWEREVPGIKAAVNRYNGILARKNYISTSDFLSEDILADHHHPSVNGHKKMFEKLRPIVKTCIENKQKFEARNLKTTSTWKEH